MKSEMLGIASKSGVICAGDGVQAVFQLHGLHRGQPPQVDLAPRLGGEAYARGDGDKGLDHDLQPMNQHQLAENVPILADSLRRRDLAERIVRSTGSQKRLASMSAPMSASAKSVALKDVAEAHAKLPRTVEVGECHHVLRAVGEIDCG